MYDMYRYVQQFYTFLTTFQKGARKLATYEVVLASDHPWMNR
jgi:hypothetical protein